MEVTSNNLFDHKEGFKKSDFHNIPKIIKENIVSWFNPATNLYMALSFQNEKAAHEFWFFFLK